MGWSDAMDKRKNKNTDTNTTTSTRKNEPPLFQSPSARIEEYGRLLENSNKITAKGLAKIINYETRCIMANCSWTSRSYPPIFVENGEAGKLTDYQEFNNITEDELKSHLVSAEKLVELFEKIFRQWSRARVIRFSEIKRGTDPYVDEVTRTTKRVGHLNDNFVIELPKEVKNTLLADQKGDAINLEDIRDVFMKMRDAWEKLPEVPFSKLYCHASCHSNCHCKGIFG